MDIDLVSESNPTIIKLLLNIRQQIAAKGSFTQVVRNSESFLLQLKDTFQTFIESRAMDGLTSVLEFLYHCTPMVESHLINYLEDLLPNVVSCLMYASQKNYTEIVITKIYRENVMNESILSALRECLEIFGANKAFVACATALLNQLAVAYPQASSVSVKAPAAAEHVDISFLPPSVTENWLLAEDESDVRFTNRLFISIFHFRVHFDVICLLFFT